MTTNVGNTDRAIRIFLGFLLIVLGVTHVLAGGMAIAGYVIGAIALVTGIFRYGPAWTVFGINTCPLERNPNN